MSKTNSDRLFHLGYVSTETGDLGSAGMVELLTEARRINTSRDITGLLLHRERSFYQVLEGAEDVVRQTFDSIEKDQDTRLSMSCLKVKLTSASFLTGRWAFLISTASILRHCRATQTFYRARITPRTSSKI